jgi:hypothetical protein
MTRKTRKLNFHLADLDPETDHGKENRLIVLRAELHAVRCEAKRIEQNHAGHMEVLHRHERRMLRFIGNLENRLIPYEVPDPKPKNYAN